jgi:biotin transport system substrate-specific component
MTVTGYQKLRARVTAFHAWHAETTWLTAAVLVLGWAGFMGLLAQVRVPLFFTPVPLTLQVFGVFLGAVLLGRRDGTLAQVAYVTIGVLGVPWFQDFNGGLAYVAGATGGYLVAMPVAAFAVASLTQATRRRRALTLIPPMLAGLTIIYGIGVTWLAFVLDTSLAHAFMLGAAPFLVVDVAKAVVAAVIAAPLARGP